ncbi:BadF/BadG/BcrA/BcrD ATPase family protein [Microbacterium pseudoresistens]|uniref:N-acetylglucosamine kinase-like BadF-type ATPase n=1 Tax=Microbacterium pseudoresistens TaxID=640634 RepID=A0A7Y9EVY8_9MICO|nr:BadF/BadG/BcrA/BcrD ATPase family protein [Microbacterium pseudoresistens]NYD54811.1 N-acetylglucosamine kinase-like BadF-type ATPase [Microbacterium pseudoresistens]
MPPTESTAVAVDLGKSRCRVELVDGERRIRTDGPGAPGLAAADGVRLAAEAIRPLLEALPIDRASLRCIGVGAAGAWASPDAAAELAHLLHDATGAAAAVTSDVVTAHAGALGGGEGVLLIAGTGAVALGTDAADARLVDGWGPDLGDFGSGSWLGREAVRAVLGARDGLGAGTALSAALDAHIGDEASPITWLAAREPVARRLATVAPLVLDAAEAGDDVAVGIRDEAVRLLVRTASAAAGTGSTPIVVHGGLTVHPGFHAALTGALAAAGFDVRDAVGDALHGATLIARDPSSLHERRVYRAG